MSTPLYDGCRAMTKLTVRDSRVASGRKIIRFMNIFSVIPSNILPLIYVIHYSTVGGLGDTNLGDGGDTKGLWTVLTKY